MPAAVTLLVQQIGTANGTKTTTAVTPAVGDLIVIFTVHTGNTSTSATPPTDDQGGTYTLITSALKASSADVMCLWVRDALIASAVPTIFTHAPGSTTGGGLAVLKVTGMSKVGAAAVAQSAKQENQAAGTPAPVFGAAPSSANAVIGAVFNATNPATMTPRASFTELHDGGYSSPTAGTEIMARNSGETATTQTWGSASASAFAAIVAELDISAAGGGGGGPSTSGNFFLLF